MRVQAHVIQKEVSLMLTDVERLDDRVGKLESHFRQAGDDIKQIRVSSDKLTKRGGKIEDIELGTKNLDEQDHSNLVDEIKQPVLKIHTAKDA